VRTGCALNLALFGNGLELFTETGKQTRSLFCNGSDCLLDMLLFSNGSDCSQDPVLFANGVHTADEQGS
jgi:hypothetical protein